MATKIVITPELDEEKLREQLDKLKNQKEKIKVDLDTENINSANQNMKKLNSTVSNSNTIFGRLKNTIGNTFSTGKLAMTGYLAVLNEINKAGKNAKQTINDLDKAITDLSVATNMSRESVSGLVRDYNNYAKELKSTTTQITSAADDYLRAGKSMSEAQTLIKDSIMLSKLGQLESGTATEDLLAVMNGYEMSIEEVGKALDAMVALDMEAATSAGDIATALKYCASSADVAGLSFNKLAAMITTVQDKTQQSAETIGTFMNTLLSRYRDVKIGQFVSDDGEDLSDVESILNSLDIKLRDSSQEFRDFETVIEEVALSWDNYSSVQQAAIAKAFSGTRQQNRFLSLMEGYNKTLELTEVAANSAGTAIDKFNNSYMNSLEAKQNALQASFESLIMNSDFSEVYAGIIEATTALVDFINQTNALKGALTGLTVAGGIKGFLAIKTGVNEAYLALNKFQNALNIVKKSNISTKEYERLLLLSNGLSTSQMKLVLSTNNLTVAQKKELLMASGLSEEEAVLQLQTWKMTAANTGLTASTVTLGNAFKALWSTLIANPLVIVTALISGAVMAYQSYNQKLEETRRKNIESATAASENADALKDLYNEYKRLASIQDRTTSEEEAFKTAVENITVALGDKAEILKDLIADTDEYADVLARATKEELQSQAVAATIGRKSAEEELQNEIWDKWKGSQVTIDSNDKGKALSDEAQKAVDIVSDSLKEFETINRTWKNISWDISSNDPIEALKYYNSLIEAREKLVLASKDDEALLDTEIYKDLNTAINTMSESLDTYIEKLYEEEKLNYMAQNGIPSVTEEYKAMESALVDAAGASVDLQDKFKELLMSDFSSLAIDIGNISDAVGDASAQTQSAIPLFNQLTTSQESLDKFQSSVKSAADAYSTLLSGNYSSSELLDSIQAINQAVTDMGSSLNWEAIDKLPNSLEQLGNSIEYVSQKYAESVLSDAGIDIDSKFGQMLANNIIQAQKASTQLEVLNDQIDSLQAAYSNLTDIVETYNKTGYITFDQLQTLLEMEPQYLSCLIDENGQLQLNEAAMTELANKRLDDAEAQAIQQAITELGQIALQDEKQAVQENAEAFTNAIDDLANYNAELANTIAEATVGASAIRDLNAAINGAESQGATDDQINTVLNNLETKLQLIGNVRDKVASGGLGSVVKSGSGSSSSSSKDTWKETYEKELKELEHMHKLGLISDEEYWKARMDLNEKYFGESSGMHQKYLEEYQDNEEEILEGIKNLWKDYYNDRKNDLKDLISYAEKLYDKEIDSLEASIKKLEERRDTEKKYWQTQIDDLDAEIDALQDANDERERAINLQEKQWALQKAIHQHTMLLYTESSGMVYHTDDKAIRDAKNDLESAEHDNKIADLKKQQKDLQKQLDSILETYDLQIEAIEKQIDSLKEVKSAWSEIVENQEFKELEERLKSIFGDDIKDKILSGNTDFMNSIIAQYSDTSDMLRTIEDATLSDIQNMIAQYGVLPENLMPITDIINDMADSFSNVADSASNAVAAISGSGSISSGNSTGGTGTNLSGKGSTNNKKNSANGSLKDAITEATTGSVEEINKIADAFAGEDEDTSVTGAVQKVIDKVGSVDSGNENSDSLLSTLSEQTEQALDEENGIPAQKTAWEELNEPLGEAVESVTTLKTTLEDLDGKEFTVTLNVTGNGASYVSNFSNNHGGGGHSRVEGTAHVEGTANARGNWGTKEGGRTLVGELGQEIVVFPDGKFRTVGDNGAEFVDIPKNSIVFNHLQTRELLNKGNIVGRGRSLASGTALANGTNDEGWWIGSDGHRYRDLQPGDRAYELQKAFEPFVDKILKGEMDIVSNAVFEGQRQMEQWTKEITNNTAINNITNKNVQQPIVNNINVTCPGVTSQQVAEQIGDVLDKELDKKLDKKFNGLHLKAMQYTW